MPDSVRLSAQPPGSSFNLIHFDSMDKVDIFVAGAHALDAPTLAHRVAVRIGGTEGHDVWFASAEDIVLRKLDWFRKSGGEMERQRRDVLGVLKVRGGSLDLPYLRTTAAGIGLGASLESCLRDAGLAP